MEVRVGQVWTKKSNSGIKYHITKKFDLESDPKINFFGIDIYYYYDNKKEKINSSGFQDTMIELLCDPPENDLIEALDKVLNEIS